MFVKMFAWSHATDSTHDNQEHEQLTIMYDLDKDCDLFSNLFKSSSEILPVYTTGTAFNSSKTFDVKRFY